ncbi:transporter substrate-binding domain-containing protein [Alkalimonas delamerensis]|uniref:Transporter substrate-binding domain-containing protein n=1 Tax=Alkalimonas delamerensis TaxID=265981 RepID=A0ABT9GSH5_9GAMM|nr:transporter substrate-binding domain-containing protein [Alkalimonas delamerensis]MDP4529902.1 transporter substrate-binding domain-containing protein [Alkalimonas delamerensis]
MSLQSMLLLCSLCLGVLPHAAIANENSTPLRILTEHSFPASYLNDQGEVDGATTQLIRLLAAELDEAIHIELLPWARAFHTATSQPRTALYETALSDERLPLFHWVGPLKVYRLWVYGRQDHMTADSNADTLSQLHTACEYRDSIYLQHLLQLGFIPEQQLVLTVRKAQCRDMFLQQRVDLIIWNEFFAEPLKQELAAQGTELVKITPIDDVALYLAFSLDHSESYIKRWQQALEQSYRDGRMRDLYQHVFPEELIDRLEQLVAEPSSFTP